MPDPAETPAAPMFAQSWAVRFGAAVLVIFTIVVACGFHDRSQRASLEVLSETTAVGDRQFVPLPDPAQLATAVATLEGQPLLAASAEPVELRDSHTRRVGQDPASGAMIYTLADSALDPERDKVGRKTPAFLLKTAPGKYLVARPATP